MAVNIGSTGSSTGETTLAERAARALAREKSVTESWRNVWKWTSLVLLGNQLIIVGLLIWILVS
jgi:hypothetical protein